MTARRVIGTYHRMNIAPTNFSQHTKKETVANGEGERRGERGRERESEEGREGGREKK